MSKTNEQLVHIIETWEAEYERIDREYRDKIRRIRRREYIAYIVIAVATTIAALAPFFAHAQSSPIECWITPGYAAANPGVCLPPSPPPTVIVEGYYGQGNQTPVIRERTCAQKLRRAKKTIKKLRRRR